MTDINPIELRLGNIVKDQKTGAGMAITELSYGVATCEVLDKDRFPLPEGWQMIGVPLTHEILTALAFKSKPNPINSASTIYWHGDFEIVAFEGRYTIYGYHGCKTFRFVHQLQNLYFALHQQEIEPPNKSHE